MSVQGGHGVRLKAPAHGAGQSEPSRLCSSRRWPGPLRGQRVAACLLQLHQAGASPGCSARLACRLRIAPCSSVHVLAPHLGNCPAAPGPARLHARFVAPGPDRPPRPRVGGRPLAVSQRAGPHQTRRGQRQGPNDQVLLLSLVPALFSRSAPMEPTIRQQTFAPRHCPPARWPAPSRSALYVRALADRLRRHAADGKCGMCCVLSVRCCPLRPGSAGSVSAGQSDQRFDVAIAAVQTAAELTCACAAPA